MNIVVLLEMAAESFPDRVAVTSGGQSLTYAAVLRGAKTAAALLRERACRNSAVLDINSLAVPVALFGAAYAGIPYVPINYRLTAAECESLLERVAPAALVSTADYANGLHLPAGIEWTERSTFVARVLGGTPGAAQEAPADPQKIAVQLFTSGTTGKPKAAVLRHAHLMSYVLGTVEFGAAGEEEATLICVPPYHIAGVSAVLSCTYAGRRMVQLPNFDPATWLELCRAERITNTFVVPTMLARIVEHLALRGELPHVPALRALAYGGGKMPLSVIKRAMQLFPSVEFTNAYGLTETSSTICLLGPEDHRRAIGSEDSAVSTRLASVGKPLTSVELQVRGPTGAVLGANEVGDVFVRAGQVSGEYLEIGSMIDDEGWFPTRDRGHVDDHGYLYLDGRADDVIVRGGENISPGEIEEVLLAHPAISDAAVVAVPSEHWGEGVGAAIVLKEGKELPPAELQAWVGERLRSSRVPEVIVFRDELPYNEMGKILRRVVSRELAGDT